MRCHEIKVPATAAPATDTPKLQPVSACTDHTTATTSVAISRATTSVKRRSSDVTTSLAGAEHVDSRWTIWIGHRCVVLR